MVDDLRFLNLIKDMVINLKSLPYHVFRKHFRRRVFVLYVSQKLPVVMFITSVDDAYLLVSL